LVYDRQAALPPPGVAPYDLGLGYTTLPLYGFIGNCEKAVEHMIVINATVNNVFIILLVFC